MRYGALHYVRPIVPERHVIKDYALTGFHDYDIVPKELADELPALDRDGWQIEINPRADRLRPWDNAPLRLKQGAITLVPIGCTILRRASFLLADAGDFHGNHAG